MKRRAKVRLEFPEKLFYEKTLVDWKESVPDEANHSYVIRKAHENLRLFPINVTGYAELRQIKGIGENIATRLDAAWKHACETYFQTDEPTLEQVNSLNKGEFFQFLETANVFKGRKNVPFVPKKTVSSSQQPSTSANVAVATWQSQPVNCFDNASVASNATSSHYNNNAQSSAIPRNPGVHKNTGVNSASSCGVRQPTPTMSLSMAVEGVSSAGTQPSSPQLSAEQSFLVYDPAHFANYDLLLIVDGREENGRNGGRNNHASIGQHLEKLGVRYEFRPLSVGDYLWVARRKSAPMANFRDEIVLDYIVERKTWDDLKRSIRQTRYAEQKRRLRESRIRNVVIVAEGAPTSDRSLEQALVSTSVDNGFLIHRTMSLQGTAKFLKSLTERIVQRMKLEHICGPSFASLQDNSRKTKLLTVKDCWLRQLTVCPMMSAEKAKLLAENFPTFRSLLNFYQQKKAELDAVDDEDPALKSFLHKEINDIPKSLSSQLSLFLSKV